MSQSRKFSLFLSLSFLLHLSLLFFFIVTPSDGVRVGNPIKNPIENLTVTIDVIPVAAPRPVPVTRPKVSRPPEVVTKKTAEPAPLPEKIAPAPMESTNVAPSAAPATAVSPTGQASALSAYVYKIVELLNRNKVYPREAIDREQEGKVVVAVTLAADGQVKEAKVVESSLYDVLNQAALRTVLKIARFPPPPETAGEFRFTAPLQYRIERR